MPASRSSFKDDGTPFPSNPILERAQSQWLFTPAELQRAPSIIDGMGSAQELSNRSKGVNFITQVGILLKLPQLTLATASVYVHRFFMRHSMVDQPNRPGLHHYAVAATALFLATKVEENCRKMRELVVACCRVAQKQPNLVVDEQSKEYWKWRDTILHNEDLLLEALCFDLQLEQPYKILFDFLRYYDVQDNKHMRNICWAYLNDANLTTMCLLFSPRSIAGSALYAGAKFSEVTFRDDDYGQPWWDHLGIDLTDIQTAVNLMADVYENSVLPRQGQKGVYVRDGNGAPHSTRLIPSPAHAFSPAGSLGAESQGIKRERDDDEDDNVINGGNGLVSPAPLERSSSAQARQNQDERAPSPKRQRRESPPTNDLGHPDQASAMPAFYGAPTGDGHRRKSGSQDVDEVQQRIDEIINATGAATSSQNPYPHPPLSRRTSQRQQPWPGPPPRRRSSSRSSRQQPASGQDTYTSHAEPRRLSPRRQPSHDQRSDRGRESFAHDDQAAQRRRSRSGSGRQNDLPKYDEQPEGNRGRSGSEEGEL